MSEPLLHPFCVRLAALSPSSIFLGATPQIGLPALSIFFFTPSENALCQRVDVRGGCLTVCSLAHERVDRCRQLLPREPAVPGSSYEVRNRLSKSWRCPTRSEGSRESALEAILADAQELSRMRSVT
jgi:hypothetical protein